MKHIVGLIVCGAILSAFGYTKTVNGIRWTYTVSNGEASIGGGTFDSPAVPTSTTGAITIPAKLGSYKVTRIGDNAFSYCEEITSITIPNSVVSIGEWAFEWCFGLTSLTIPNSVTNIGQYAFSTCVNLQSLNIGSNVASIGDCAFTGCRRLSRVSLPDSVVNIGYNVFYMCSGLVSIEVDNNNPSYSSFGGLLLSKDGQRLIRSVNCAVQIPDSVSSIEDYAFSNCDKLTSVTIPDSVTRIGRSAFGGCSGLTSVTIPNSVTNIGSCAFYNCSSLTSVAIPDSVTSIGDSAFGGCADSLYDTTTIPGVKLVDGWAVDNTGSLSGELNLTGARGIGSYAFSGCSGLTSVTIPDSVTSIGDDAFYNCSGLTSVTIGDGVTSIGNSAFRGCKGLTSVTIPASVTSIGYEAFSGCSGLTSVTIPEGVTNIGLSAFYGCSGLTSVTIPEGVTNIGLSAFSGCSGLTSVTIPDSVTSIGSYAFSGCSGLTSVYITDLVKWCGISFGSTDANPLCYAHDLYLNGAKVIELTIPDCVTNIGSCAFYNCSSLTSVAIPDSVTSIGSWAFRDCSGLTSVTISQVGVNSFKTAFSGYSDLSLIISDGVTDIGSSAFSGCNGLVSVTIPDSVTSIGSSAFYNCSGLKSVTIPNSVTSIGEQAFRGCSSIADSNGFVIVGGVLYCYYGSGGIVTIPDSVTNIGSYAFSGCSGLTSVTIPDSVTSIGEQAFYNCSGLTSVTIPDSMTSIGEQAFRGCSGIADSDGFVIAGSVLYGYYGTGGIVTIPGVVTNIGSYAFSGCSGLTSVTIPDTVTSIGNSAFRGCKGLTSVTMPDSVTSIGEQAFYNCSSLMSVTIPEGVTNIGSYAFYNCSGLTSVTIPSSVTSIEVYTFYNCSGLTSVTIPDSVTSIEHYAFSGCADSLYDMTTIPGVKLVDGWAVGNTGTLSGDLDLTGVRGIGSGAFSGCTNLTNVAIPDSVASIGSSAFYNCGGLTSITIPDSVTSIGNSAFRGCSGLTSVTIPDSVTSIKPSAFYECKGLTSVYIADLVKWCRISFGSANANPLCYAHDLYLNGAKITELTIPGGVTNIGSCSFYGCTNLTSVTIPDGVTSIGYSAFSGCSGLTSVTMPNSVTSIENYAFYGCGGLTNVIFSGDAPTMGSSVFSGVPSGCHVYVRLGSTGWGVDIPGIWQGLTIAYLPFDVMFDANGGECVMTVVSVEVWATIGELPTPTRWGYVFKGWWTAQEGGDEITIDTVPDDDMTLYAHWESLIVAPPVIVIPDNLVFYGDSCEVTLACATEGATIYYSPKGATPRLTEAFRYTGPFTITDTSTIKTVAVLEDVKSEYVTTTITKATLALGEAASANAASAALPWTTGGDADWIPMGDATAASGLSAQSGVIGDEAETWMQTVVSGVGTFSFNWKVDCEWDDSGDATWDRVVVTTNGVEAARMDGTTGWIPMSFEFFDAASHTIRWTFVKDDYDEPGADYADCAWVSGAVWTPAGAADHIPAVVVDADVATVNAVVDDIGFADAAAVKVTIGGSAAEYNKFKTWADGVKGVTGDALAGEAAVVANAHAAAAYLLGAERLFENEPTIEIGELAIVDGESAGTTTMTVAVTVKDGARAVAVSAAKVAAMFEATGDLGDWTGAAKLTPMVTNSGTDASGKMTFVVIPGDGTATKAFFRIRK